MAKCKSICRLSFVNFGRGYKLSVLISVLRFSSFSSFSYLVLEASKIKG